MSNSVQSLWPTTIGAKPLPAPVRLLGQQGVALKEVTNGRLYGEVIQPTLRSGNGFVYDFYVGVTDKPFRHKLLSIEFGYLFDYPVVIQNHEAATTVRVADEKAFREELRNLLNSHVTQELLGRLLAVTGS